MAGTLTESEILARFVRDVTFSKGAKKKQHPNIIWHWLSNSIHIVDAVHEELEDLVQRTQVFH